MINLQPQHPRSAFRFDPVTILTIALVGAAGFGIAETIGGMNDAPKQPNAPALPDANKAGENAQDTVNKQRRLALLTGGQTDYTEGSGALKLDDVNKTLLLGG